MFFVLYDEKGGALMSQREVYEKKTEELILPILDSFGFELVDVEYVKEGPDFYLRAYIDKPGGITIDDCVEVSRQMNEKLDALDFIPEAYIFEVSSPGLGRPLKKEKDYARNLGNELEIRTYKSIDKQKEFYGILKEYDETTVTIETEEKETMVFSRADIALIRQALDF
jgi:ribosome maturation factor RimP